ncbi:MAG: type II toxin-antitoxin system RelE/ParE family toxin [Bacteroidales bacterium]|nr:type II toxin-antitoxin system RelE/ParE family toxin [Bacteroidales bacterium]
MNIHYSPRAFKEYITLLEYTEKEWSYKQAEKLDKQISDILVKISKHSTMFRTSKKQTKLHCCPLLKHTIIYYRIKKNYIEVVSFRGGRMNPKTLNL